ncbi:MAG: hypothetical protein DWQ05_07765 [Calditrichaeota bacterium]|nr:MAG: hypothetical protein DWQ05_07765 [Calditrichota bacterium]
MKFKIICVFFVFVEICIGQEFIGPHGYLTFEAEISNKDSLSELGTFDLHHFNIMGNYLLNPRARVFGEIEWEHGTDLPSEENLGMYDSENSSGSLRLERAWFEYALSPKLKFRFGKYLTPYGIYNEIHDAAPAFDTSVLPYSIYGKHRNLLGQVQRFYSKFSLGIVALGRIEKNIYSIEYKVFISNGRGTNSFENDDNKDKGLGSRLLFELPSRGLKFGYSVYTDKNGRVFHSRQTSHSFDLRFEKKRWRLTGEFAHSRLGKVEKTAYLQIANAAYGELAYLLLKRQTVLIRYDVFDPDRKLKNDRVRDITIATNYQIIKRSLIKAEVHFWHDNYSQRQNYVQAIASLAVVF